MNRRMSVNTALQVWGEQRTAAGGAGHISPPELYELLIHPLNNGIKEQLLEHLTRCPVCLQEAKEIQAAIEAAAAWDLVLPRAAASEIEWPKRIPSEGGKYVIEIRRSVSKERQGVITVKVAEPYKSRLEGKTVSVTDGMGRRLVTGQISDGEVSQVIDEVDGIVLRFLVRPE